MAGQREEWGFVPGRNGPPSIEILAISLMEKHGLRPGQPGGWTFAWDRAAERAGHCVRSTRTITLSAKLMRLWTEEQAEDTILHEIAHALTTGAHNLAWARKCEELGIEPARCWDSRNEQVPGKYTGTCPNGHTIQRHRLPAGRRYSCPKCSRRFSERYLFTWRVNNSY